MKKLTAQYIKNKLALFFADKQYIAFSYLFGSMAKNAITPLSDIDIAVFVDVEKASADLFDLKLKELTALYRLLGTENIDLVFLNDAPLALNSRIVKQGILVFERDEQLRVKFEENIIRDYLDKKYFVSTRNKIIRQKMLEGSYFD